MKSLQRRLSLAACLLVAITTGLSAAEPAAGPASVPPGLPAGGESAAIIKESVGAADASAPTISASDLEFFEKKIRPVLATRCHQCHGPEKQKGGLRLDSHAALLAGGDSGLEIVPGKPGESRLIEAVRYENPDLQMPPKGKLPAQEIADLTQWVAIGSPWPAAISTSAASAGIPSPTVPAGNSISNDKKEPFDLAARKARHWCWQPLHTVPPPPVTNGQWVRQPVDQFILARLEKSGMTPAPQADRRVLVRRATFDLLGLPPTPAEVEAFVNDASPTAWETVLDRLLASPHFGERWARHWMDLVRYAESRGHEFDSGVPNAHEYRDYLIRAYNADVPYDQFVTEHIAGDLLPRPRMDEAREQNESVLATGFWFLGEWMHSPVDIRQDEMDRVDNQIDVMCKTFLGLTVACARCHDHKFDAISTRDYYSLAGFLHSSSFRDVSFQWQAHNSQVAERLDALQTATAAKVVKRMASAQSGVIDRLADYLMAARELARAEGPDAAGKESVGKSAAGKGDVGKISLDNVALDNNVTLDKQAAANGASAAASLAFARELDETTLVRWRDEIAVAGKDRFHPLHCWAKAAADARAESPDQVAAALRVPLEAWRNDLQRAAEPLPGEVIVDYSKLQPGQWFSDGLAFGSGPVPAGYTRLGSTTDLPIVSLADPAAADSLARGQALPGVLRTPTFTVSSPILWYRVRGSADVFVVVDSHRMVAGPLHFSLKAHVEADNWKWHRHDLTRYVGQRAHIEFRPGKSRQEIAIAVCLQSTAAPAEPSRVLAPLLESLTATDLGGANVAGLAYDIAELAARYQHALAKACSAAANMADRSQTDIEQLRLAEWCFQHPTLFGHTKPVQDDVATLLREYQQARGTLTAQFKSSPTAMALSDQTGVDEHVLLRGSPKTPGPAAPRRYLEALGGADQPSIASGSGRLDLARQMVDPRGSLTSRVMVNRVWHHLFGRGLVPSVDNFGVLGSEPSHPELLDHLAMGFVQDGWSVKRLIRRLMLSSSYQMSSQPRGEQETADPLNALLHRANLRRLEAEAIRDALLVVSGRLDPKPFGPSVDVHLTEFMEGRGRPSPGPLDGAGRRSIYTAIRRNFLPPMMLAFDMPIPFNTMGRRAVSNVPAQPLILLNDPLVVQLAGQWADRTLKAVDGSAADRVRAMYLDGFSRQPTTAELDAAMTFFDVEGELLQVRRDKRLEDRRLWADFAHVLVNTKEFIFIP